MLKQFYEKALPQQGVYCVSGIDQNTKKTTNRFAETLEGVFNEIEKFYATLLEGDKTWLALAAFLQILYYTIYTFVYQSALDTVGVKLRFKDMFPLTFATLFVNVAAPTYGASAAALFADEAGRHGQFSW